MNFTFNKSFQEFALHSGLECHCVHKNGRRLTLESLPEDHGFNCPVSALHKEWQEGAKVLWERVKHIPLKPNKNYRETFEYPDQVDERHRG
jgi:hypothetical protein